MNETTTEVHIGEHAPVFYTNTIAVEVSGTDAKLVIGQIKSIKQGRSVVVLDVAHIYMTREHLRAMAGVLASVVASMVDAGPSPSSMATSPGHGFLPQ